MSEVNMAAEVGGAAYANLDNSMKRIGLSRLYEAYHFPHPTKAEVEKLMSAGTVGCVLEPKPGAGARRRLNPQGGVHCC